MNELHRLIAEYIRLDLYRRHIPHTKVARAAGMRQQNLSRRLNSDVPFTIDELDVVLKAAGIDYREMLETIEAQRGADRGGFGLVLDRPQQGLAEDYERRAGASDEGEHDARFDTDDGKALG